MEWPDKHPIALSHEPFAPVPGIDRRANGTEPPALRTWGPNRAGSPSSRLPLVTWPDKSAAELEEGPEEPAAAGRLASAFARGLAAAAIVAAFLVFGGDVSVPGSGAAADALSGTPSSGPIEQAAPASEDERANSYLLTSEEFPAGWRSVPGRGSEAGDVDGDRGAASLEASCISREFDIEPAGQAEAAFTPGAVFEVTQGVSVFDDAKAAERAMEATMPFLDCMVAGIERGVLDTASIKATGAVLSEVSFGDYGEDRMVRRLEWEMTSPDFQNGAITAYFDFVFVRQGDVVMTFFVRGAVTPFPTSELEALVELGVARIGP